MTTKEWNKNNTSCISEEGFIALFMLIYGYIQCWSKQKDSYKQEFWHFICNLILIFSLACIILFLFFYFMDQHKSEEEFKKVTVKTLQSLLRQHQLSTKGVKNELVLCVCYNL